MLETYLGFNNPLTPKYKKSNGIFLIDSDNNKWLDLFSNYSSLPLGHNFPDSQWYKDTYQLINNFLQ